MLMFHKARTRLSKMSLARIVLRNGVHKNKSGTNMSHLVLP